MIYHCKVSSSLAWLIRLRKFDDRGLMEHLKGLGWLVGRSNEERKDEGILRFLSRVE